MSKNIQGVLLSALDGEYFEAIQVRSDGLNEQHVERLKAVLEGGGKFKDTIVLYRVDGKYLCPDGNHRIEASRRAGKRSIKADVRYGTREEAVACAESANLEHGLGLKKKDIRKILCDRLDREYVETLENGEEVPWLQLSNGFLGSILGVPSSTVGAWVREWMAESDLPEDVRSVVFGRDGRKYDVTAVRDANVERVSDTTVTDSHDEAETPPSIPPNMGGSELSNDEMAVLREFIRAFNGQSKDWMSAGDVYNPNRPGNESRLAILSELAHKGLIARHTIRPNCYRPLNKIEMERLGIDLPSEAFERREDHIDPVTAEVSSMVVEDTPPSIPPSMGGSENPSVVTGQNEPVGGNGSDDENQALIHRSKVEQAAFNVIGSIEEYLRYRGIAQLHVLDQGLLVATSQVLEDVRSKLERAMAHTDELDSKLAIMIATGKDYHDVSTEEKSEILHGWGGMNEVEEEEAPHENEPHPNPPREQGGNQDVEAIGPSFEIEFEPSNFQEMIFIGDDVAGLMQKNLLTLRSYCEEIFGEHEEGIEEGYNWLTEKIKGMTVGVRSKAHELSAEAVGRLVKMLLKEHEGRYYHPDNEDDGDDVERDTTPFDPDSSKDQARVRSKMQRTAVGRWGNQRLGSQRSGLTMGSKKRHITFVHDQDRLRAGEELRVYFIETDGEDGTWFVCGEDGVAFGFQVFRDPGMSELEKHGVTLNGLCDLSELDVEISAVIAPSLSTRNPHENEVLQLILQPINRQSVVA